MLDAIDPMSIPLWAISLYGFLMYPLGFMLGSSCSPCCGGGGGCGCEPGADLPEYVTVTFSGVSQGTDGVNLLNVSFSSCFGSGAKAEATAPIPGPGPISTLTLTNPGSGYAVFGREEPSLTITGSGSGLTFTPTLTKTADGCKRPEWSIASVKASGEGEGYTDGEQLTVSLGEGSKQSAAASLILNVGRSQPNLSFSVSGGAGAAFDPTYFQTQSAPSLWAVTALAVTNGGSGYTDDTPVTITLGPGDVEEYPAEMRARTQVTPPEGKFEVVSATGSGATFGTPSWSEISSAPKRFQPLFANLTKIGTGYQVGDEIVFTVANGTEVSPYSATVEYVGDNGEIFGYSETSLGEYYWDRGIIESVEIDNYGGYYNTDSSVTVNEGGRFYGEDPELDPIVAEVAVSITNSSPGSGDGATATATVDDDTTSPTFGQIESLELTDGGDDYLMYDIRDCCQNRIDGIPWLLRRNSPTSCRYSRCGFDLGGGGGGEDRNPCVDGTTESSDGPWTAPRFPVWPTVTYRGRTRPPIVEMDRLCPNIFTATGDGPWNCEDLSFVAENVLGATATVSAASPGATECDEQRDEGYSGDTGCCVGGDACTQEECEATAGGTWYDPCWPCPCNPAGPLCEEFEVTATATLTTPIGTITKTVTLGPDTGMSYQEDDPVHGGPAALFVLYNCRLGVVLWLRTSPGGNAHIGLTRDDTTPPLWDLLSLGVDRNGCPAHGFTYSDIAYSEFGGGAIQGSSFSLTATVIT